MSKYKVKTSKHSVRLEDAKVAILKEQLGENSITQILERIIDERIEGSLEEPSKIKSPIIRIGGKSKIAEQLVALMPEHKTYVDVFGGAFHVLFAKPERLSKNEIINDKYDELINFFRVVRDQPYDLREKILEMPKSRTFYEELKEVQFESPLDKAYRFYYLIRNSRNGSIEMGFDVNLRSNWRQMQERIADELPFVSKRLKNVMIENGTWQRTLKRYGNNPDNLLFIDPPYLIENKRDGLYELPFDLRDTRELAKRLKDLPCKIMVTHYENPRYEKYFDGWSCKKIEVAKTSGQATSKGTEQAIERKKPRETEVVYMNYDI